MSDQWIFFPCQIGEHTASVFFDHGIHNSLDNVAPRMLLKVRVPFKQPRPDGMPTNDEFQQLMALEDGLKAVVQEHEGVYVGRITTGGHRLFYIYTSDAVSTWTPGLQSLRTRYGYPLTFVFKADAQHAGYWQELYPTDDDWQVIQDLRVLETLAKEGDNGTTSRKIDHWAYFASQLAAEQYSHWLKEKGYSSIETDVADNGSFRIQFCHEGTVRLAKITSHTIVLQRKANELGGNYDGWETVVCKAE